MMNTGHTLCWPLLLILLLGGLASAQPPLDTNYSLRLEQKCEVGSEVVTRVLLDNGGITVSGWSFGICHDPAVLNLIDVMNGSTTAEVNNGAPPAFNGVNLSPGGGAGYTIGAVIDLANNFSLPVGTDFELYEGIYSYVVAPGSATTLDFCGTLGSPVVDILITLTTITGVLPLTAGETVVPLGCFCENVNTYTGLSVSFEEVTPGPIDAAANAILSPLGVVLTNISGGVEIIAGNGALPAVSPPQLIANPTGITLTDGIVDIDFVVPATGEDGAVTQASFALVSDGIGTALVTAYANNGQVVFAQNFPGVPDGREMVQIFAPEIDRIEVNLDASGSRFGLDDLCFDEPFIVLEPPIIDVEPVGDTICEGDPITLSVVAFGPPPLTYQWSLDDVAIPGATTAGLTINNAQASDSGAYSVAVTNMDGTTESGDAIVTVVPFPSITVQPLSVAVCAGDPVMFTVVATGTGLTYQWFFNGLLLPTATGDTLTLPSTDASTVGDFTVEVSQGNCTTLSMPASLMLLSEVAIVTQPTDATLCAGDPLTLTVGATGDEPLTYQWRVDGVDIPGANDSSYDLATTTVADSGSYDCVVMNPCGSETSDPATVTVIARPSFTMDPGSQIICTGDPVTLTVTTDPVGGVTYQWRLDGIDIPGATGSSYSVAAASPIDAGLYSVVAALGSCSAVSAEAMLSVVDPVVIVTSPSGADLCVGDSLALAVSATGDEPLSYQWSLDGTPIAGATGAAYSVGAVSLADGGSYECTVSNACSSQTTIAVLVVVSPFPAFTTDLQATTACIGEMVSFSVVTDPPATDYQWYLNNAPIAGATAATYDIPAAAVSDAGTYRVDAIIGNCLVSSADALLTLLEPVVITVDPVGADLCVGDDTTLTVVATGSPTLTYQWRLDGAPLAGETAASLMLTNVQTSDAGDYDCLVSNACGDVASAAATVTVTPIPQVATSSGDMQVCVGDAVTLSVTTTPAAGVSYQWNFEGTPIAGANGASLAFAAVQLADAGAYSVTLSIGACQSTTPVGTLTVLEPVVIVTEPLGASVCEGDPFGLSVVATGTAPITYQWQLDGSDVPGATASTLSVASSVVGDAGSYVCLVTNACGTVATTNAPVAVTAFPTITSDLQNTTGCLGQGVTLSVVAVPAVGVDYQWFLNGAPIAGATSADYPIASATVADAGLYQVTVASGSCVTTSSTATLTLQEPVSITLQPVGVNLCGGDSLDLSVAATGELPLTYQWRLDGAPIAGATASSYSVASVSTSDSGSYDCVVSNPCGDVVSDPAVVAVTGLPVIVADLFDTTGCIGEMITLSIVSNPAVGVDYQWTLDGAPIAGATSADYTIAAAALTDAGVYQVAVSAGSCVTLSSSATLTLQDPIAITTQPTPDSVCAGESFSLTVAATGEAPISYQWRLNGAPIAGATASTYSVLTAQLLDTGVYDCVVTNRCGAVTSDTAQIDVIAFPIITADLVNTTACLGDMITLSVGSTPAAGVDYQWLLDGVPIPGATAADYVIAAAAAGDAGVYQVTVAAGSCVTTSSSATLTLLEPVEITVQPVGINLCGGDSLSLSVTATGELPLTYQWRLDGAPIAGATTNSYNVLSVQASDSGSYDCVVSNACGDVTSDAAVVAVTGLPVIVTDLVDTTGCLGEMITLSVVSMPAVGVDYQWFLGGAPIPGATAADYVIAAATATDAGVYQVTVSAGSCVTTSSAATLTLLEPVSITVQPVGVNLCGGDSLSLSVAATGELPLTYQWRLDGAPIAGATTNSYNVLSAQASDSGSYDCVVSNTCGDVTSDAAVVAVTGLPVIVTDLVNTTGCLGEMITLSVVSAPAVGVDYQWTLDGVPIPGATAADYVIAAAAGSDAGVYQVTVSAGSCVTTSSMATLTLQAPVSITQQPIGSTLCGGDALSLSIAATGEMPLTYQWRLDGTPIVGATSSSYNVLTTTVADSGAYDCVVSNRCGDVFSDVATVLVTGLPVLTTDLQDLISCIGATVTLGVVTVPATGLDFQWFQDGAPIPGETSAQYVIASATTDDIGTYSVTVSAGSCTVTSSTATLALLNPVSITGQPAGVNLCSGDPLSLNVAASGSGALTYQWRLDGNPIPGATSSSYNVLSTTPADSGSYDVVVTNSCGSMTSGAAIVSVTAFPTITMDLLDLISCIDAPVTLSVTTTPPTGLDFQWFKDGTRIAGATNSSYTIASAVAADAGDYQVQVSAGSCVVNSAVATLALLTPVSLTSQPIGADLCEGDALNLSVAATGSAVITYQWRLDGADIAGATASSYSVAATQVADGGVYDCLVTNSCGTVASDTAAVSVTAFPLIVTEPLSQVGCVGTPLTLEVVADPAVGVTYQWFKDGSAIAGANASTFDLVAPVLGDAGDYTVEVSAGSCTTASATASVSFNEPVTITMDPASTSACVGDPLSLVAAATGTAPLTYQWRLNGAPIVGATSNAYNVLSAQLGDAGNYDVVVTNPCGSVTSGEAVVAVVMAPTIVQQPQTTEGCFGQPLTLSVVTDPAVGVDYQWFLGGVAINGANSADYQVAAASAADLGDYTVEVSLGSCQTLSNAATVTLLDPVMITLDPDYSDVCVGDSFSLTVGATGTAPLTYQWQKDGGDIVGATASSYNVLSAGLGDEGSYVCVVTNACGSVSSNVASITVTEFPVITLQPATQLVCVGDSVTFDVSATPATAVYQWFFGGVEIAGANGSSYTIPVAGLADAGDYTVVVSSGICSTTSSVATLTVDEAVVITSNPQPTTDLCVGAGVTLTVAASGTPPLAYQWRLNGVDLPGETTAMLSITASAAGTSTYDCVVSNACSSATSAGAVVNEFEAPLITQDPTDQAVCVGDLVTLTVLATGSPLSYQWQLGGIDLPGETAPTLSFTADLASAGSYNCVVSSGVCPSATSTAAVVTVNEPVALSTAPSDVTVCEGFATTLVAAATGTAPLSYQWALDGIDLPGATQPTLAIAAVGLADAGSYTVTVSNVCGSLESTPAIVTVTPAADCDCNGNLILDSDEIAMGTVEDCNANGIPDSCDIASGFSLDTDLNGIPDECQETEFQRGDCIADGSLNILDATMSLDYLFQTNVPPVLECFNACDSNDDDSFNLADAVFTLNALFVQMTPIPAPFLVCGVDPTPGVLDCAVYSACP